MASDIIALFKPKITIMALMLAISGMMQANSYSKPSLANAFFSLLAIALLIASACALNMYIERNSDGLMERTKNRPLPSGRLSPTIALILGIFGLSISNMLIFYYCGNLTFYLSLASVGIYLFFYTPLKPISSSALFIGSIPGAMPVMLGYVARSDAIDEKAIALFAWAYLWQIPHFLAISIFREKEYEKANIPVISSVYGVKRAKTLILGSAWLLIGATYFLMITDVMGGMWIAASLILNLWFLFSCHKDKSALSKDLWAQKIFKASLVYQSLIFFFITANAIVT